MTSPTGGPAVVTRTRAGFTLLELLLVVTLMALATTLAVPRFKGTWQRVQYERSVDRLTNTLRVAHDRAIREHRVFRFALRSGENAYVLERQSTDEFVFENPYYQQIKGRYGRSDIAGVVEVRGEPDEILFFPSGASTGGRLELAHKKLKTVIHVAITTGDIDAHTQEK